MLQVVTECGDYQRKILDVGQGTVHLPVKRHAVCCLGHVESMLPIVVWVVEHARAHAEDELLQLLDRHADLGRKVLLEEHLEGEVHKVVG